MLLTIKKIRFWMIGLFALSFSQPVFSQNCTVNAGVPEYVCKGAPFILKGETNGQFFSEGAAIWNQISGPTVSLGPQNPSGSSLRVNVNAYSQGQVYKFRISARCADGSQVYDDVTFTTQTSTVANAGPDIPQICTGTLIMAANAPLTPIETGTWTKVSGPDVTIVNPSSPTTPVIVGGGSSGKTVLRWKIINASNGCTTSATVAFTSTGVGNTVSAGSDQNLGECYNLTQSSNLQASYGGNGTFGQSGTWTFLSGPTIPIIENPNNNNTGVSGLKEGTYVFRWTVTGPCANGSDEVSIIVPKAKQAITSAGNATRVFCDNTTATVFSANPPSLTNETGIWSVVSGSGTIVSPNSPTTSITGLTPGSTSTFRYTITNNVTGCVSAGNYSVFYSSAPSISFIDSSIVLPTLQYSISIPFTYTGGIQTSWQLVSGPVSSTLAPSGSTGLQSIGNATSLDLEGLDQFGTYRFRLVRYAPGGLGACSAAADDGYVVISLPPTPSNPGTNQVLDCNDFDVQLAANQPFVGIGSWSMVSGPNTPTILHPFSNITDVTGLTNGVYYFRWLINAGPGSTDQQKDVKVVVSSLTPTTAKAGSDKTICAGSPLRMEANAPGPNETAEWSVTPSAGVVFGSVYDSATTVTGLAPNRTYTFTWTITSRCGTSFSNVIITTNSSQGPNIATAGVDQCLSGTVSTFQLAGNAPAAFETGLWKVVSGPMTPTISNPTQNNTTVTGASNGTYLFEWSLSTPGCDANKDTVRITASAQATAASVANAEENTCNVSTITLNGNTPTIGTGLWTRITGPGPVVITSPSSPTSTVAFLNQNFNYIFRWTISNGACASSYADVKYFISATATAPTVGMSQVICGQTSTTLTGNPITSGTGLWVFISGPNVPTFSSMSNPTATLSGLIEGVYKLKWTSYNGLYCPQLSSPELIITVREKASANVIAGGTCNATAVQLYGNAGSTGTWSTVSGPNSPTLTATSSNSAIASGLIGGTYTFMYTLPAAGTCAASTATTSITLYSTPTVALAGPDQDLCAISTTTLAGNTPVVGVGQWTFESKPIGSTAVITNPSSPTTTLTNLSPGDYLMKWTISNGSCTSNSDLVRVTYYATPTTANAGVNQNNACSSEVQLNGNTPVVGIGTWTQVSGAPVTIDAPNSPNTRVNGTVPGVYKFMWTISNGNCQSSTSVVTITVSSTPPNLANAGPNQNICNTGVTASTFLAAISPTGLETGLWTVQSKPAGSANPTITDATLYNTQISGLEQGKYVLLWTVTNGACQSASSVTLTITNQPTPANAGADFTECLFKTVAMSANPITTGLGTWSVFSKPTGSPDPVFEDENLPTSKVYGLVAGNYIFTWNSYNGPGCPTSSDQVNVQMVNPPTPAQAGNFQTICVGTSAVMAGNSPTVGLGTWTVTSQPGGSVVFTNPNAPTTSASGFIAGTYTLRWTIASGGCISYDETQITVQSALSRNIISSPQLICSGTTATALTGTIPLGGNGSTYSYQWESSTTSNVAGFANIACANGINFSPGVLTNPSPSYWYRRKVTSGACTTPFTSNTIEITVQPPITSNVITLPFTNVFCQSGNPEIITGASPTGGDMVTYNYQWQKSTISSSTGYVDIPGATLQDYDPPLLTSTTWYRRIVTSGTCTDISAYTAITVYPYPVLTSLTATSRCNNLTFTYTATSSVAGTSYAWSQSSVANINGGVAASGATANINLLLSNSDVVPVQTQFYYTLTANGCTNPTVFTLTVTVNPTPSVDIPSPSSQTVCNGLTTVAINFGGSLVAGTVYNWTNDKPSIGLIASGIGNTIASFTAVNNTNLNVTATITVTPMSNGCNGLSKTSTILVYPTPNINTIPLSTCTGIAFSVTPTNNTNGVVPANTLYRWDPPHLTSGLSGGASATNSTNIYGFFSHTSVAAETATYTVIPSTAQCNDAKPFTVIVTINPIADITSLSTTVCAGVAFQVSPVNSNDGRVPAGTKYTWLAPTGSGFSGGVTQVSQVNFISGTLNNTINTLSTATYVVTPVSGNCVGLPFTLQVNLKPKAIVKALSDTRCSGLSFSFTPTNIASGIVPDPTTYTWGPPTGIALGGLFSQTSQVTNISGTLTNSSNITRTATYLVTPLSGDCTGNVFSVTVFVDPVVSVTSFSRVTCSGANFSFSALNVNNGIVPAGTQYTWQSPTLSGTISGGSAGGPALSISGNLSQTTSAVLTATYVVTPSTTACGPGADFTLTVFVNPIPSIGILTTSICSGFTFTVTPTNGTDGIIPFSTTYTWQAPTGSGFTGGAAQASGVSSITGKLSSTLASSVTATYRVTPTAANCSGDVFTVVVQLKPLPVISAMSTTICSGATYQFSPLNVTNGTVPDGTLYSVWDGATWLPATSPITGTLTNVSASVQSTTFQVQPSVNGCVGQTFSATVFVNPIPSVNAIALTTCSGVSFGITPVNGTNGLVPIGTQYTWLEPTGSGFTGGLSQSLGVNNFTGKLTNVTASIVTATYQLMSAYMGCNGNTFTITVSVYPTANILSLSTSVCSGTPFSVSPIDIQDGLVPSGTLYTWLAPTGSGLTNGLSQTTPVSAISGNVTNTTASLRTAVYQVTPVSGSCTGTTFSLLVNVQPKASINPISAATCSGVGFTVDPSTSATGIIPAGTLYTWTTPLGTGFTGGAAQFSPVASITGILTMTVASATSATYQITPVSGTCTGTLFTLVVNLQPKAAIQPIAISVCSGVTFNVVPLNTTNGIVPDGTQYTWLAPAGTGFSGGAAQPSAASGISGKLFNTSVDAATAVYTVTPLFGACSSNAFTVSVRVNAQSFISAFSQSVCTGESFTIIPAATGSNIIPSGTLFTWMAPAGSGFSGGLAQNTPVAALSGTLTNANAQAVTAVYTVTPITNGCSGTIFTTTLFVQPAAAVTAISATICSGNSFVVVPTPITNGVVPSGTLYSWAAPSVPNITGATAGTLLTNIYGNLTNTSANPISVTYQISTISGTCSGNVFTLVVLVKPVAAVQNLFTATCSGVGFELSPQNDVNGLIPSTTKYSWLAPTGTGITNGSAGNLANTITGNLTNTTALVATATYVITPIADNCAGSSFTLLVQVKPKPTLNSVANASPICSGTIFQYTPTSATPGVIFSWSYISVSGISAAEPLSGTGAISQLLTNTTNTAITVTYIYSLNADGCIGHGTDAVNVLVKPIPAIAGTLTPANIYTGTVFNYNAQSTVAGSTFNWVRNPQPAINNNIGNSGSGAALSEVLSNSSSNIVFVPYQYTITAAGCLASQTVTVGVVPALVLSSTLTPSPVCSGTIFSYTATSDVPGVAYTWKRNAINTINNNIAGSGTGAFISESLTSSEFVPVVVTYDITLAAFGLSNTQQVTVIVQPTPSVQQPASQQLCNQGNTLPVVFTGNVQGSQYQWVNDLPAIGLPASGIGNIPSFVGTNSGSIPLVANITITPVSNTCSGLPATFSITIQPTPTLSNALTATAICSGTTFTYTASSQTSNVNFTWQRESVTGITATGPASGVGNITNQVLRNISQSTLTQTYLYTLTANGCINQQRVSVEVLPEPRLTSTTTPPAINGGNEFAYAPTSSLPATAFSWSRAFVTGIDNPSATGANNIREILFNPTTNSITVTYVYILVSAGCIGTAEVKLRVNPNRTTLFPGAISGTQAVCIGTPATAFVSLSPATGGNGTITYRWQSSLDNVTFNDIPGATALTYAAGTLSQTTYFRRVAVSGDQEFATNVVVVTINKAVPPIVTPAGPLFLVTGGSFTLTSTTAVAYMWSNSATTQSITVTAPGGYRVTITDANGCKDTSNLVAVSPPPPVTINATYIIGNPNNPPNSGSQVTGLPGAQLKYYLLSAGGTVIPVPALPSSPGTYTYYVSQVINGYESIRVPYTVTMIEPFKISDPQKVLSAKPELQPDGSFIIRFSIYINNNLSVLLDSIRMKDDLTKVFPSSVQFEVMSVKASGALVANQQYNGSSNIELLSDGSKLNPSAKDSINLVIRMIPNGFFGILKNTATLTAKTPYGTLTVNSNDPSIGTGVGSREPTPFEIPGVEIFVPGGFSPNQDGINDYLVIRRPSTTIIQLEIFNRWGNPVYRSGDYKNDWNGRTNQPGNVLGPEIPDGTYYYIVTGTDRISGKVTRLNGFITVKR